MQLSCHGAQERGLLCDGLDQGESAFCSTGGDGQRDCRKSASRTEVDDVEIVGPEQWQQLQAVLDMACPQLADCFTLNEILDGVPFAEQCRKRLEIALLAHPALRKAPRRMIASRSVAAAGVIPSITCACASVAGRLAISFCRISLERPGISA